ncbi:MAG TPA: septum formation initiator family protein [Vicinamibacterales bacterium]|jgi:cell division protein FtsB
MSERDPLRRRTPRRPPTGAGLPSRGPSLSRVRRLTHWLLLFFACALLLNALVGDNGFLAMRQARRDYDRLQATVDAERADNARLREEARLLREDPEAIEDAARRELGLISPGERLFILKDVPPAKP